jgi:hypothetical protein
MKSTPNTPRQNVVLGIAFVVLTALLTGLTRIFH